MEIDYTLTEEDLQALVRHQIRQSPLVPQRIRRRRALYVIGFALLALGTYLSLPDRMVSYLFALSAVVSLLLYGTAARRRLQTSIPDLVRSKMTAHSLGERRLRALPDGLEAISLDTQSKVSWSMVGGVESIALHVFIPIDGVYSVVIPVARVKSGDLAGFLAAIAEHKRAAS